MIFDGSRTIDIQRRDTGFLCLFVPIPTVPGEWVRDTLMEDNETVRHTMGTISPPNCARFGMRCGVPRKQNPFSKPKNPVPRGFRFGTVFGLYACTKSHPNVEFGGDIAQYCHWFLLSPHNVIINSTSQRPWEQRPTKPVSALDSWSKSNCATSCAHYLIGAGKETCGLVSIHCLRSSNTDANVAVRR